MIRSDVEDMNRRSITNCRWRFFTWETLILAFGTFFRSVFLRDCQSLCFHLLGRGKRPLCTDMHVFTTGQKDKVNKIEIHFGSIVFSSVFHLWKKNQWGDNLYEVSHNGYEMPRAFPTVMLCTWYKQDPNQYKTEDLKVKLSRLYL